MLSACEKHSTATPKPSAIAEKQAETPAVNLDASKKPSAISENDFAIERVPLTTAALPPFPFLAYPEALPENLRHNEQDFAFEEAYVIAGSKLRKFEGHLNTRVIINSQAQLSASGSRRNHQQAIEALGGVKLNQTSPTDPKIARDDDGNVEKVLAKMRLPDAGPRFGDRGIATYDCYLIRSAQGNTWITVTTDSDGLNTFLMTVQEKPLVQSVHALTAESIATALNTDGHLALYLSFDTDKTTLQSNSSAVLSEVVKMMQSDPSLKLNIEGHTDNAGSESHNKTLSEGRAGSVKSALVARGIIATRMESKGFGARRPIADNFNEEGRVKIAGLSWSRFEVVFGLRGT